MMNTAGNIPIPNHRIENGIHATGGIGLKILITNTTRIRSYSLIIIINEFINSLFEILESTEATTLTELVFEKFNIFEMIKNSDKKDTQIVGKALAKLLNESRKIIFKNIFNQ